MIEVTSLSDADGHWRELRVSGHAAYATKGNDVVCAAASTLAENLESGLRLLLELEPNVEKKEGYHKIQISKEDISEYTQLLFASALLGLHILEKNHPEHVLVKEITQKRN